MSERDGGPAFPGWEHFVAMREDSKGPVQVITGQPHGGISVRDYFAAKALLGLACSTMCDADGHVLGAHDQARCAYEIADAMLKAREAQ